MNKELVLRQTEHYVKQKLSGAESGHEWWHAYRVRNLALKIGKGENADCFVVEVAALLHDIADWKFNYGNEKIGADFANKFLSSMNVDSAIVSHVCYIIENISFKGAKVESKIDTIEGKVVQDADRLDALGAIGIARTFVYGGYSKRSIHEPQISPVMHASSEEYKKNTGTCINHFYEKLLLLKDRLNTDSARKIAEERHKFMEQYLERFFLEWDCRG